MTTPHTRTPVRRSGTSRAVSGRSARLYLLALALPLAVLVDVAPAAAVAASAHRGPTLCSSPSRSLYCHPSRSPARRLPAPPTRARW